MLETNLKPKSGMNKMFKYVDDTSSVARENCDEFTAVEN